MQGCPGVELGHASEKIAPVHLTGARVLSVGWRTLRGGAEGAGNLDKMGITSLVCRARDTTR
jgi:hypothetical protein